MELGQLLLAVAAATVGALVALPWRGHVPAVVGQIAVGLLIGVSGLRWLHTGDKVVTTLADVGFALVMLVAGSHVPLRDPQLRGALRRGLTTAVATGILAAGLGVLLAKAADTGHGALYAVLLASSSAALVLPVLERSEGIAPTDRLATVAQIAIADVACVVALPLAEQPSRAVRAGSAALLVTVTAVVAFALLHLLAGRGVLARLHDVSVRRQLGLDLRISLVLLLGLAALAQELKSSVMIAGFSCGLILSALGEPRRLAGQLFAVSDGFLAPVFFVRLGATIDLGALGDHPRLIAVGAGLGFGAVVAHAVAGRLTGRPLALSTMTAGQLGVPIAAVAFGETAHTLRAGEGAAILLGAIVTMVAVVVASGYAARRVVPAP